MTKYHCPFCKSVGDDYDRYDLELHLILCHQDETTTKTKEKEKENQQPRREIKYAAVIRKESLHNGVDRYWVPIPSHMLPKDPEHKIVDVVISLDTGFSLDLQQQQ